MQINMTATYVCSSGQTVFDVAINIYTDLDNVINLLQSSDIDNINESNLNQKQVNYSTDLISDFIVYKYIFSKKKRFNTGKVLTVQQNTVASEIWMDVVGNFWQVFVTADGVYYSIEASPTDDYIESQLWIDSDNEIWTITLDSNGVFSPLNEGSGIPLSFKFWDIGTTILTQTIDLNGIFAFN